MTKKKNKADKKNENRTQGSKQDATQAWESALESNDLPKVASIYQAILKEWRSEGKDFATIHPFLLQAVGRFEESSSELHRMRHLLRDTSALFPDEPDLLLLKANFYVKREEYEDAASCFRYLYDISESIDDKVAYAEQEGDILHLHLKRSQDALLKYQTALRLEPKQHSVLDKAIEIYMDDDREEQAKQLLDSKMRVLVEGGAQEHLTTLAEKYVEIAQRVKYLPMLRELALDSCQKALELHPENASAKQLVVELQEFPERWKSIAQDLRKSALEIRDKQKAARQYLAVSQIWAEYAPQETKPFDENIKRCLMLFPGYRPALRFLEQKYRSGGRIVEFISFLKDNIKSVAAADVVVEMRLYLTILLTETGAPESEIIEEYRAILKIQPRHAPAMSALSELYVRQQKFDEAAEVIESFLKTTTDERSKINALETLTRLYEVELGQPKRAAECLEKLYTSKTSLQTLKKLRDLYEKADDAHQLARTLERLVEFQSTGQPEETQAEYIGLMAQLFELQMSTLNEPSKAFQVGCVLFRESPTEALQVELERLSEVLAKQVQLGETFCEAAGKMSDEQARIGLLRSAVAILLDSGDASKAGSALEELVTSAAFDQEVGGLVRRYLQRMADPSSFIQVIEKQLEKDLAEEKRLELLSALAEAFDRLGEKEKVIETLEGILREQPRNRFALDKLHQLYLVDERFQELSEVLTTLGEIAGGPSASPEAKGLFRKLARLYDDRLGNESEAVTIYIDLYHAYPEDLEVIRSLERIIDRGVEVLRIAEALQPYYAQAGIWNRYVEMLSFRRDAETDIASKGSFSAEIAQVKEEHLKNPQDAFSDWVTALLCVPQSADYVASLVRLSDEHGFDARLSDVLQKASGKLPDGVAKNALLARRADLLSGRVGDEESAIDAHLDLLEKTPSHLPSIDGLIDLFQKRERWTDLAKMLHRRLDLSSDADQLSIRSRLGLLQMDKLHDKENALPNLCAVTEQPGLLNFDDEKIVLETLARHYRQNEEEDAQALAKVLQRLAEMNTGDERAAYQAELGHVHRLFVGDVASAVESYAASLVNDSTYQPALDGLWALLGDQSVDGDIRVHAGDALLAQEGETVDAQSRLQILGVQLDLKRDESFQRDLVERRVKLLVEELDAVEEGVRELIAYLEKDPAADAIRERAEALAPPAGCVNELLAVFSKLSAHETGAAALKYAERMTEIGMLHGNLLVAADGLRRLLAHDDTSIENWEKLRDCSSKLNDEEGEGECLYRLSRLAEGDERLAKLRLYADYTFEVLNDPDKGLAALREARDEKPDDVESYTLLQFRLSEHERFEELVEVIGQRVEITENTTEMSDLLMMQASILQGRLDRFGDAIVVMQRCLNIDPNGDNAESILEILSDVGSEQPEFAEKALDVISEYHRAQGNTRQLCDALEAKAMGNSDKIERAKIYDSVSNLQLDELRAPELAFRSASMAFQDEPTEERVESLYRLADMNGVFSEMIAIMEDTASSLDAGDTELTLKLYKRAIQINEKHLGDINGVVRLSEAILSIKPSDADAMETLETIHRNQDNKTNLINVLQKKVEASQNDSERVDALMELANVLVENEDWTGAEKPLRQAMHLDPSSKDILFELQRLYDHLGNVISHLEILRKRFELAQGEEQVSLHIEIGSLLLSQKGDAAGAVEEFTAALDAEPASARVRSALEALMMHSRNHGEPPLGHCGFLLERCLRAQADWVSLPSIIELRISAENNPVARANLLKEISKIQLEKLDDSVMGFMTLCRAIKETPADEELRRSIETLSRETDNEESLIVVYEDILENVPDKGVQIELNSKIAEIAERVQGDVQEAESRLETAIRGGANDLGILERFVRLKKTSDDSQGYLEGLSKLAQTAVLEGEFERAAATLRELIQVNEEQRRYDEAIDAVNELLKLEPNDGGATSALERLYRAAGRWDDLDAHLVETLGKMAGAPDKQNLYIQLVDNRINQTSNHSGAVETLEDWFTENGETETLCEYARVVFDELRDWDSASKYTLLNRVGDILEPFYERAGSYNELTELFQVRIEGAEDDSAKKMWWSKIAEVELEKLNMPEKAMLSLAQAMQCDPSDGKVREMLYAVSERLDDFDTYASLLEAMLEDTSSNDEVYADLAVVCANLYAQELKEPQTAVGFYEKALEALSEDETNRSKRMDVGLKLEALYRALQDGLKLSETLYRRGQDFVAQGQSSEAESCLFESAQLMVENVQDMRRGQTILQEFLDYFPAHDEALTLYADVCENLELWTEHAESLDTLLRRTPDPSSALALKLQFKLAVVLDKYLFQTERATELLEQILSVSPQYTDARDYLETRMSGDSLVRKRTAAFLGESYQKTGDWSQAIQVMQKQFEDAERNGDSKEAVRLILEIGNTQRSHLNQPDMAFMTLCRGIPFAGQDENFHRTIIENARECETLEDLLELYDDEALRLDIEGSTESAHALRRIIGEILVDDLGDVERAVANYRMMLEKQPGNQTALDALIKLYEKESDWNNFEDVLRQRLMFAEDDETRRSLMIALCRVLVEEVDRADEALLLMAEIEGAKDARPSRTLLIQIHEKMGDHQALRELLELELHAAKTNEEIEHFQSVRRQLALVLAEELSAFEDALPLWEEILEENPNDVLAAGIVEELYEKTENWAKLRDFFQAALEKEKDPQRISLLTRKLGTVLAERLGGAEEAISKHLRVLELRPKDEESLHALRRLYRSLEKWSELVVLLRKMMRFTSDPSELKELRFDLAAVLGEELGKRAEAAETGRRILSVEPHTVDDLKRLSAIFEKNAAWPEACQVYQAYEEQLEGAERETALLTLARIQEEELGQLEQAASSYAAALNVNETNEVTLEHLIRLYESTRDWQALVQLHESRLHLVEEGEKKSAALVRIGQIYDERLQQKEMAFLAVCRAYREDYSKSDVAQWMDKLAVETDATEELMLIYDDALGFIDEEQMIISIHLRMAALAMGELDDLETAETHFLRVLEYQAAQVDALDGLIRIYETMQNWSRASELFRQKADATADVEQKITVLRAQALMLDERANEPESALQVFRLITDIDPANLETLQSMAEILERVAKWEALIDVLGQQADSVDDIEAKIMHMYRAGGIWEQNLQNLEMAISVYREILEEVPDHQLSLKALERLYSSLDRGRDLIDVYEDMARVSSTADEKVVHLNRVATLWVDLFQEFSEAIKVNQRIFDIQPDNVDVVRNQQILFRETGSWSELINMLQKEADIVNDLDDKAYALFQIGQVYDKETGEINKAEQFYLEALQVEDHYVPALNAIGALYERSGNWFNALSKLSLAADLAATPDESVALYYRIGKINLEMLLDTESAVKAFSEAVDIDQTHIPSIRALKEIALQGKDKDLYVNYFRQEIDATVDDNEKTELYSALGNYLHTEMLDSDAATVQFEKALALDFSHLNAAMPLAYICFQNENWERAESLLDIIVDQIDGEEDSSELCKQYYRLAFVCEKLEKHQKALKNYQRAYDVDSTFLPAMEGLGAALNRAERWNDAAKVYQAILIDHRDGLTDAEIIDYHQQLGLLHYKLGEFSDAKSHLEKALKYDPGHRNSLRLLGDVHESANEFEEAYEVLLRLVDFEIGEDRIELLIRLGRLSKSDLDDPYRAIDAYEDANRQSPGNREVLDALLPLYKQTKQANRSVEVIEEIVRIEPDEQARVRLNFSLGEIYRDELKNPARAIQFFNASLELDPTFIRAFEAVEEMLSKNRDWRGLEENYVAMIRRIPEQRGLFKQVLWKNLGDLYRFKLKDLKSAIQAFRVLEKAKPNDPETLEILAELLARDPATRDDAILKYHKLLERDPKSRIDVLHMILRLYLDRKRTDRAYCVTGALAFSEHLQPEEEKLHLHYLKQGPRKAKRALTSELWTTHLYHPGVKSPFLLLSRLLYRVAAPALTQTPRQLGLDKKKDWARLSFNTQVPDFFLSQLKYVGEVLGNTQFEVFVKRASPLPVQPLNLPQPALGVGQQNEVFREIAPDELWFLAGQQIAYLQTPFFLPKVLGAVRVQACFEAAVTLFEPDFQVKSDPQLIAEYHKILRRAGPEFAAGVAEVIGQLKKKPGRYSIQAYLEGIEHTANRAGLLLCGHLPKTGKLLKIERPGIMRMNYAQKMEDLLQFSVSKQHFELREKLQIVFGR